MGCTEAEEEKAWGVWDGVAEECVVVEGPAARGALGRVRIGSGEGSGEGGARSCHGRWSGVRGAESADNVGLVEVGQSIIDPSRGILLLLALAQLALLWLPSMQAASSMSGQALADLNQSDVVR